MLKTTIERVENGILVTNYQETETGSSNVVERIVFQFEDPTSSPRTVIDFFAELASMLDLPVGDIQGKEYVNFMIDFAPEYQPTKKEVREMIKQYEDKIKKLNDSLESLDGSP